LGHAKIWQETMIAANLCIMLRRRKMGSQVERHAT